MNILDEDIDIIQRKLLLARKIHFRQIGFEIGRFGMKDRDDVVRLLICGGQAIGYVLLPQYSSLP